MPLTTRAGHTIYYETHGDPAAPPLLLIMGLSLSMRAWDRLPELLAAHFHVLVFDNRGTGRSGRTGFAFHMRDLADDAAAVIEACGAPRAMPVAGDAGSSGAGARVRSAHVFGISMGGMIAQELALRHPERVRGLALGATFAGWLRSTKPTLRTQLELLLLNSGFVTPERMARVVVSPEWHQQNPAGALAWIRRAERTTVRFVIAQLAAIARHGTARRLGQIKAPTLVITGTRDALVPPQNSALIARLIPHARLLELQGAGHAFPLEREQETVRALVDHFQTAA